MKKAVVNAKTPVVSDMGVHIPHNLKDRAKGEAALTDGVKEALRDKPYGETLLSKGAGARMITSSSKPACV